MATAKYAWGIDIGNRALKAVRLTRVGDDLRVDGFDLIEHDTILSEAGDDADALVERALATFVSRNEVKKGIAAVSVSGQASFARFIKLPPVEPKKIPEIVRFEAIQQIPFPLDDVEWSYQLFEQEDNPEVEVGIFAMRKELVAAQIQRFSDLDMNVQVVQTSPLAVYNALQHDGRLRKGTAMIVDLGAEATDLIIADDNQVWMRSIPIGGNNFTETLVKAFKVPFAKAEELKQNASSSKYARQIFQAMRPVFADLVGEIQRTMGFYSSANRDSRIRKVVALGGTFKLPALAKYLQQNLQLPVERPDTLLAGAPDDPKLASLFSENILSSVGAYGLALQAMDAAKIESSLLPSSIRRETMWRDKTKWFAAAAALFIVGAIIPVAAGFLSNQVWEANSSDRQEAKRVLSEAKALDQRWSNDVASGGERDLKLVNNVESLLEFHTLWPNLLADIQNAMPAPQPEVQKGLASSDAAMIKQVPRPQRNLIMVRSIRTKYLPDLSAARDAGSLVSFAVGESGNIGYSGGGGGGMFRPSGGGGGMGSDEWNSDSIPVDSVATAAPEVSDTARGFAISLSLTSPNAGAPDLLDKQVLPALDEIKPDAAYPNLRYRVIRRQIIKRQRISDSAERMDALRADYDAWEAFKKVLHPPEAAPASDGRDGYPSNRPQPGIQTSVEPRDRLTDEDISSDYEFEVVLIVELDPPAFQEKPAENTDEGQASAF